MLPFLTAKFENMVSGRILCLGIKQCEHLVTNHLRAIAPRQLMADARPQHHAYALPTVASSNKLGGTVAAPSNAAPALYRLSVQGMQLPPAAPGGHDMTICSALQAAKRAAKEAADREAAEKAAAQALIPPPANVQPSSSEAASRPAKPRRQRRRPGNPDPAAQGSGASADQPPAAGSDQQSVPDRSAQPAEAPAPGQSAAATPAGKGAGRHGASRQGSSRQQASQGESGQGPGRHPGSQADPRQGSGSQRQHNRPAGPGRQHDPHVSQVASSSHLPGQHREDAQHQRAAVPSFRAESAPELQAASQPLSAQLGALSLQGPAASGKALQHEGCPRERQRTSARPSHSGSGGLLPGAAHAAQPRAADSQ